MIMSIHDAHVLFIGVDEQGNSHAYHISLIDGTPAISIDNSANFGYVVSSRLSLEGLINYQETISVESQQESNNGSIQSRR